jgi:hypothetical protein
MASAPWSLRSGTRRAALVLALVTSSAPLAAQYPLAPTPLLPRELFSRQLGFTGYLSVRQTLRDDTSTFSINRARITAHVLPVPFAALRVQADFSAIGRSSGDTVPAFALTDAYVVLSLPDSLGRAARLLQPTLAVGQFRTPFSLEYLTPFAVLLTANRSQPVERLSTRRDIGVLGQVRFARFAALSAAVVNGEGPNRTSNTDGKEMTVGRLTLFPAPRLALSGKWLSHSGDHRWGYDARWIGARVIIEGEAIKQRGPRRRGATLHDGGGYVLFAYTLLTWLQPVVKWERVKEVSVEASRNTHRKLTWTTYGINVLGPQERLRFQINWVAKSDQPTEARNELVAQLQAIF